MGEEKHIGEQQMSIETTNIRRKGSSLLWCACNLGEQEVEDECNRVCDRLQQTDVAEKYYSEHRVKYEEQGGGFTVLRVLQFLEGLPFDNLAIAYIHALQPTCIRATFGCVTCDAVTGRVTVFLDRSEGFDDKVKKPTPTIRKIEQEVQVLFGSGYDVGRNLEWRKGGKPPKAMATTFAHRKALERCDFS